MDQIRSKLARDLSAKIDKIIIESLPDGVSLSSAMPHMMQEHSSDGSVEVFLYDKLFIRFHPISSDLNSDSILTVSMPYEVFDVT